MRVKQKRIVIAMFGVVLIVIIAVLAVLKCSKNKADSISISTNEVDSILVVNNIKKTTKTINQSEEVKNIISSLNDIKTFKSKESLNDKVGEITIFYLDKEEVTIIFYQNGISFENNNYNVENFDFEGWYDKIGVAESPFERNY